MPLLAIDDVDAPLYTVGQVSSMLAVQAAFLRRLDAEGVVSPSRTDGNQRRYSRAEIDRVRRVADFMGDGMTLVGIRQIFVLEAENRRLHQEINRLQQIVDT